METPLDGYKALVSFVKDDNEWWTDVAQRFEDIGNRLGEVDPEQWQLLAVVCRERASVGSALVEKIRLLTL